MAPGFTPLLGVGGLGGGTVGFRGDKALANIVFRKALWSIGRNTNTEQPDSSAGRIITCDVPDIEMRTFRYLILLSLHINKCHIDIWALVKRGAPYSFSPYYRSSSEEIRCKKS